jgi:hypothetical protein
VNATSSHDVEWLGGVLQLFAETIEGIVVQDLPLDA